MRAPESTYTENGTASTQARKPALLLAAELVCQPLISPAPSTLETLAELQTTQVIQERLDVLDALLRVEGKRDIAVNAVNEV